MEMTVELFDNIINTSQDCVFWKDKERRFLGVNQAFLDYYGFDSVDVLIGKTDEDMGWHSDPEPYKRDELRVLSGRSTYKVQGKCIIRGEERDIIASKRPLYEGGNIVGLVGSFVDVTEVIRRRNGLNSSQLIYDIDNLRRYSYFDSIIDEISLEEILDPLTGILSRSYSMKFVRYLISENIPFTFTMLDLDNFKFINDSFGHRTGDEVLAAVAGGLAKFTDGYCLVGRFGGDEILLIDLKNIQKEDKDTFFKSLYKDPRVLRRELEFEGNSIFVTGTAGSATFPADADNFDDLFALIDKMLYLGKSRGRNCYTIYDKEKHSDIELSKIAKRNIFEDMQALRSRMEKAGSFEEKLKAAMVEISQILQIRDIYYVREDGRMKAVIDEGFDEDAGDISALMKKDCFSENTLDLVKRYSPRFYTALKNSGFMSTLVVRVRKEDKISGYLVCAVNRSHRIWQESECAILYYIAGLL